MQKRQNHCNPIDSLRTCATALHCQLRLKLPMNLQETSSLGSSDPRIPLPQCRASTHVELGCQVAEVPSAVAALLHPQSLSKLTLNLDSLDFSESRLPSHPVHKKNPEQCRRHGACLADRSLPSAPALPSSDESAGLQQE